jgi:hypothetical protein
VGLPVQPENRPSRVRAASTLLNRIQFLSSLTNASSAIALRRASETDEEMVIVGIDDGSPARPVWRHGDGPIRERELPRLRVVTRSGHDRELNELAASSNLLTRRRVGMHDHLASDVPVRWRWLFLRSTPSPMVERLLNDGWLPTPWIGVWERINTHWQVSIGRTGGRRRQSESFSKEPPGVCGVRARFRLRHTGIAAHRACRRAAATAASDEGSRTDVA